MHWFHRWWTVFFQLGPLAYISEKKLFQLINSENRFSSSTYYTRLHVSVRDLWIKLCRFRWKCNNIFLLRYKGFAIAKRWRRYITVRHGWCAAPRYTLGYIDRITQSHTISSNYNSKEPIYLYRSSLHEHTEDNRPWFSRNTSPK